MRQAIRPTILRAAFRPLPFLLIAVVFATGCLVETRRIQSLPPATLRKATLDELTAKLRQIAAPSSLKATVVLELTIVNKDRTKEDLYHDVKGAIVARRPGYVRVQAQVPVTGQRAFDMVSDGETFQVYLPWKNRIYEGDNALDQRSEKREENIRPQHILQPLLIETPRDDELLVLRNTREGRRAFQVLQLLRKRPDGSLWIARSAWFDRVDFQMVRYLVYEPDGEVATIARYEEWTESAESPHPGYVVISRPEDGYSLAVRFVKPGWDGEVADTAFELEAPKGVKIVRVGEEDAGDEGRQTGGAR